jgi:alpha-N-arabinofuranosidase
MSRLLVALSVCWPVLLPGQTTFIRTQNLNASIEIDAYRKAGYKIPRTIYGTFLEPIGSAVYGGLLAQVLENPSFEENLWSARNIRRMVENEPALERASDIGLPLPWEPLDAAQGWRYEPRWGDAANSARSLLIMALPGAQTGVRQRVYLPVHRVLRYMGAFYARHVSGPAVAEVSIRRRNQPGAVLAQTSVPLSSGDWARYEFTLELKRGQLARLDPADFVLALRDEGRALVDQVFLFPADHLDGMEPEMIAMSKALRTPVVRFGGNFTSGYHWRDAVGPMDKRVSMLNQAWGIPEYNHFGTGEFLRFCKHIGAEPQIALNLGSGTPEEAADWVRYVSEGWRDRRGGLLWELGNELWGNFQIGYPTLERAALRTEAFSKAVRAVDPRARLIATGQDPDHFREWNAKLLDLPPGTFEFLATHFVVGAGVRRENAPPEFVAQASLALPVGLERALREMKAQIDADPDARGRVRIAFTEWLFHHRDDRAPRFANMGGALCAAGFLNTLIRVADFVPIADMTGLIEFGGIWKKRSQVYGVPAYWAFRMYSASGAAVPVETRVSGEGYDIQEGNHRIPEIRDVPYLDVVAALNEAGNSLSIFCVNRHLDRDIPARVRIAGFVPASARVTTLAAGSIYTPNDEADPEAVHPVEGDLAVSGPEFEYRFRRASVTVLELRR